MEGLETLPVLAVVRHTDAAEQLISSRPDDFILEPFRKDELLLRIESLLSKRRGGGWYRLDFGEVVIDFDKYEVTRGGRRVDLTYKEHELLRFLSSNPGKPFTREVLLDRVWGADYIGGVRTVDVHVRRLRAKLGDLTGNVIETVRGVGYRFRNEQS
jgi:two-component system alkaline phosphatase synthesis response regulator PhoP